ncbi:hypothetical protein [Chryseobacterium sp. JAH]|uniref:hypothetical protein n=1 Tax=Chryseobacterium sp. JAH TaxID=1742858 RepID=UPI000740E735|nr:hypothetical protein [Chryseobacterium sp. JAH]KUJ49763.1 hypothetical protein AR685_17620 [Chryseobacterium sp. JAH]
MLLGLAFGSNNANTYNNNGTNTIMTQLDGTGEGLDPGTGTGGDDGTGGPGGPIGGNTGQTPPTPRP